MNTPLSLILATLTSLAISASSYAKDYQVEAILFHHNTPHTAYEAIQNKPIRALTSKAPTWPLPPSMLLEELETLNRSSNYTVVAHYSWGQEALPTSQAAIFTVANPDQYGAPLEGWIKVYADHLLFANLDLEYNGYRLNEKRRLKLNEKHYFDHPRFGVLLRVSRLDQQATEGTPPSEALDAQSN